MSFWLKKSKLIATCAKGISPYLQAEMRALDFPIQTVGEAAVETAKGKDAVADRFRQVGNRRPDFGAARDRTVIHL